MQQFPLLFASKISFPHKMMISSVPIPHFWQDLARTTIHSLSSNQFETILQQHLKYLQKSHKVVWISSWVFWHFPTCTGKSKCNLHWQIQLLRLKFGVQPAHYFNTLLQNLLSNKTWVRSYESSSISPYAVHQRCTGVRLKLAFVLFSEQLGISWRSRAERKKWGRTEQRRQVGIS